MCQVSFENIERVLNYKVRFKFCDDTDNNNARVSQQPDFFSDDLKMLSAAEES